MCSLLSRGLPSLGPEVKGRGAVSERWDRYETDCGWKGQDSMSDWG